ncbi:MAG: sigma-70 family RNA polymerase sigma factor [Bryobacteraceae bacterium]|nr:sigma-70 family RNA polymerase sigma factor [Bryobacteraceae bacterium]
MEGQGYITTLLAQAGDGDRDALDRLFPLVYGELRRVAAHQIRRERPWHTLGVSGLVNETYLKLVDQPKVDWRGREHFFAIAARAMRQILIDYARRRSAEKREGERKRTTFEGKQIGLDASLEDLLALDKALDRLDGMDSRMRHLVEYRYFLGLTEQETAELLGVTLRTVQREWVKARAWLNSELYAAG